MCGIAAAFGFAGQAIDRAVLRRMSEHMRSRGPDGHGEWFALEGRVGLVHRRLSIIDLSDNAAQPMLSDCGRFAITFNGEIYNYRELREELESEGVRFRTASDTEVLLALYIHKGPEMLSSLRGMFAFAIWDGVRKGLWLARDPYGIKPLYYAIENGCLHAASQVKTLREGGVGSHERDPAGEAGFLLLGSVPEPFTWFAGISALPAGHTLWCDERGVGQPSSWLRIEQLHDTGGAEQRTLSNPIREALQATVRAHLVADVPVAVFLSSGIDSTAMLALATEAGGAATAVTLGFDEFKGEPRDEVPLAASAAQAYGARHVVDRVSEQDFRHDLPAILQAMDQPSIDGINAWFVAKAARKAGFKVALSGLGGDELFGGYPSFTDIPRWVHRARLIGAVPASRSLWPVVCRAARRLRPGISPKLSGLLALGRDDAGAYLLRRGLFLPAELSTAMGEARARAGLERLSVLQRLRATANAAGHRAFDRIGTMEACWYMRNQLLRDADWAGMAHGVEIRVPLVDATLLRDLAPYRALLSQHGKDLLAQAPGAPLPDAIRNRRKTGFETPIGQWQRQVWPPQTTPDHWSRRHARWITQAVG